MSEMDRLINLAKENIEKDFTFNGHNYFCDIDSDNTLFVTMDIGNDVWEVVAFDIEI